MKLKCIRCGYKVSWGSSMPWPWSWACGGCGMVCEGEGGNPRRYKRGVEVTDVPDGCLLVLSWDREEN